MLNEKKPVPKDVRWQDFVHVEYRGQTNPGRGDGLWQGRGESGKGDAVHAPSGALAGGFTELWMN